MFSICCTTIDDYLVTMDDEKRLLKTFIECACYEPNILFVFDFDDTLIMYDKSVSSGIPDPGIVRLSGVKQTTSLLRYVVDTYGPASAVVLTARTIPGVVRKFLKGINLGDVEVHAVGYQNPLAKGQWIDERIKNRNINYVAFFDDKPENIQAVASIRSAHPNVGFFLAQVHLR